MTNGTHKGGIMKRIIGKWYRYKIGKITILIYVVGKFKGGDVHNGKVYGDANYYGYKTLLLPSGKSISGEWIEPIDKFKESLKKKTITEF